MRARNDSLETAPAMSWLVLRLALVAVAATGAFVLCPLVGWQWAAVALALLGAALPPTFGGWGAIACIVIGMLVSEPDLGRAMLAVLIVHLIHVLTSLTLVVPRGSRVVLAALRASGVRLVVVQAIAQPVTVAALLVTAGAADTTPWAVVAAAVAVAAAAVVLISGSHRGAR